MSFSITITSGNLTRDPELRHTPQGTAVLKGSMAINRRFKKDEVNFVDFQLWGKQAESFHRYHRKGSLALVIGELRQDTWQDKDTGQMRSKLYVNGDRWEFCTAKGSDSGGAPMLADAPEDPWANEPEGPDTWDPFTE